MPTLNTHSSRIGATLLLGAPLLQVGCTGLFVSNRGDEPAEKDAGKKKAADRSKSTQPAAA